MKTKVRPSSGVITFKVHTPEGERTISTGTNDKALAKEIIKACNVDAVSVAAKAGLLTQELIRKLTSGGGMTVMEAIEEWQQWLDATCGSDRTAENHALYVRAWARSAHVKSARIGSIREHHISNWINAPDGTTLGTRRVKLAAVRSLFKFCSIRQYISGDPSRLVRIKAKLLSHEQKEPEVRLPFTDAEIGAILGELRRRLASFETKSPIGKLRPRELRFWIAAVLLGRYAGLRLGDIASLEWSCFAQPGKLIVWTDKHDARVALEMNEHLREGAAAIPPNNRKLCFPDQDRTIRTRSKRSKLSVQFMRILESVGVSGKSFHCLRHTYATECKRLGIPTPHIQERLGHSNQSTTEGYIHS